MSESEIGREERLTLQSTGMTLLGVLLSIGVTVGFGVGGPWWVRVGAGAATTIALVVVVGVVGRRTRMLARAADWITQR